MVPSSDILSLFRCRRVSNGALKRHFKPFLSPKGVKWCPQATFQTLFVAKGILKLNERDSDKFPELKNIW